MNDYIIVIRMYVTERMDQIHIHYSVDDNLDIKNDGCFCGANPWSCREADIGFVAPIS